MTAARTLPAFSAAFALCYAYAVYRQLPIFVYYPALGEITTQMKSTVEAGPPMLWYGWIAFAASGGCIAALLTLGLSRRLDECVWPLLSWTAPFGVALFLIYLAREWFQQ